MDGTRRDDIDRRILAELADNARIPLVALAAHVHLSRNAVRQRIERMERDGVIAGYTVIRAHADRDTPQVTAVLFVYRTDRMRGGQVLAELAAIPEVVRCDILAGEFDLLVTVQAESMDRVGEVWERIAALREVANTVTSVALTTVIDRGMH
jgi:Lrp/AsnC family leucine-responsive transcriptional regulator